MQEIKLIFTPETMYVLIILLFYLLGRSHASQGQSYKNNHNQNNKN